MENGDYYPVNALRVCIDEYSGDVKGRIYSRLSREALFFGNLSEMFLLADKLFDDCGYPQSFQEKRNFGSARSAAHHARPRAVLGDGEIRSQAGRYRTIDVLIRSRSQTGWQGSILNEKGKQTGAFQSEMELLRYMDMDGMGGQDPRGFSGYCNAT